MTWVTLRQKLRARQYPAKRFRDNFLIVKERWPSKRMIVENTHVPSSTLGHPYNEFGYYEPPPTTRRFLCIKIIYNKKVLLRERKSHTARCVLTRREDTPSCLGQGGYPIQSWIGGGGTSPSQVWMGGYPILLMGGVPQGNPPFPGLDGGVPHSADGGGGYPRVTHPSQVWMGVPHSADGGTPISRMGYPHVDLGWGTPPPVQTSDGVPLPLSRPGMGYPPHLDLGWGTPPPTSRPEMGYPPCPDLSWGTPPPPPSVNRLKILPSVTM